MLYYYTRIMINFQLTNNYSYIVKLKLFLKIKTLGKGLFKNRC
jgi:hypothetical protein